MPRVQIPVTDVGAQAATLTTALAGSDNDLTFTARKGGSWGNDVQVAYVDPGGATASLSVVVSGPLITVNLARAASAIITTANDIKTAIERKPDARALVEVELAGAAGTGIVTALAATSLAGGSYGVTNPGLTNGDSSNDHYYVDPTGEVELEIVSTDAGAQSVSVHYAPRPGDGVTTDPEVVPVAAGATVIAGPFPAALFNQNAEGHIYVDPSVSNTLDFRARKVARAT